MSGSDCVEPSGVGLREAPERVSISPIVREDMEEILAALGPRAQAFSGETILITGAAGFLGFYLTTFFVHHAVRLGIRSIIALDNFQLGRPDWLGELAARAPDVLSVHDFDIAHDSLGTVAGADDAGFVIHAASIASPSFYRQFPLETVDANIWGLRSLLDTFRQSASCKGFLFFSSSEIYGDPPAASIPTREDYRGNVACLGPRACYDESKRFGETLCWIYASQFGLPITIARPFNNFGPGMRLGDRRLPADFAQAVMNGEDIVILSDGSPTRTFCYISDAIAGYLLCLTHGSYDFFNIGTSEPEISVRRFAAMFQEAAVELLGYRGQVRFGTSPDPAYLTDNPNRRCPDIAKARTMLGYRPSVRPEVGIRRYLAFLRDEAGR